MLGGSYGFTINQPVNPDNGGGGSAYTPERFEQIETVAFVAGALIIGLPHPPVDATLTLYYNGVEVLRGSGGFTLSGEEVTIEFSDDPSIYDDEQVVFEFRYWYTT